MQNNMTAFVILFNLHALRQKSFYCVAKKQKPQTSPIAVTFKFVLDIISSFPGRDNFILLNTWDGKVLYFANVYVIL